MHVKHRRISAADCVDRFCIAEYGRGMATRLLPNRLAELRRAQGLTLETLSRTLGVAQSTVNRWERGQTGIPDRYKLDLAEIFAVSVPFLMGWEPNGNANDDPAKQRRTA